MRYYSEFEFEGEMEQAFAELELEIERLSQEVAEQEGEGEWEGEIAPGCPNATQDVISAFTRYSNDVPASQMPKLQRLADVIVGSFRPGCQPIRRVTLVGHADRDLQRESREPGYMVQVSHDRAVTVLQVLWDLISDNAIISQVKWEDFGAGDGDLIVENPVTEAQRQQNRRVEIEVSFDTLSCASSCERDFQACLQTATLQEEIVKCKRRRKGCLIRCGGVPV